MRVAPIDIKWNPEFSIYASEQYLKSVGHEYGWLGGMDEFGNLICILPYTIIRKSLVRMVRFRIETIPIAREYKIEEEMSFLNQVVEFFRSQSIAIIIPATTNAIFRTFPGAAIAAPYGTLKISLNQTEETLWSNLHSKHRNVIRNALKKEVKIHNGLEYVELAYDLIKATFKRSSLPFMNCNSFYRLIKGLDQYVKVFIAEHRGEPQGCAVIPFSNYSAYYVYGGSVPTPLTGAMNLLQWEAIKYFNESGVRQYDFCGVRINPEKGSKQAGLYMFKERFGSQLFQGFMWKCSLHPIKSYIYSLGVRLFRGGDIVDAEHHKLES
jgi:hypothetical protein